MLKSSLNRLKNPGTRLIIKLIDRFQGKDGLKNIQIALNYMGKYLKVDGIIGPITIEAIKQVNNKKLHAVLEDIYDGTFEKENIVTEPYWIDIAMKELGVKEIPGPQHNPRVLEYHSVSGGFSTDEVPWCASFVNFIMLKAGYKGPKWPAAAKSWLKFGKSSGQPVYGAIAVKSRKGGGHVCFVVGQSKSGKYLYCLGGNQNDEVNIRRYPKNVFIDFRIPTNYVPKKEIPIYNKAADISGKES